jgi:glycosyltransferase involved in cell wall biosynthesis
MRDPRHTPPAPRVHFVNRFFHPDTSATSQILSGIATGLASRGFETHVTAGRGLYGDPTARLASREIVDGVIVRRIATTRFSRSGTWWRALDDVCFLASVTVHLVRHVHRGDILVAKTDPPLLCFAAALVGWLRGAIVVNWLQDLFPEVAVAAGIGGRPAGRLLAALLALRDRTLKRARCTVAVGERMAAYLRDRGLADNKVRVIGNWSDPDQVRPQARSGLRPAWGLEDKLVVGYAGNLGRVHEYAPFVEAIRILAARTHDPVARRIVFAFIGGGALRAPLEAAVRDAGLPNVRFFPYQPAERLADTLALADIHLVSLRPEMEGFVVPSKIYGVMAAARPVVFIGAPDGELAELIRHHAIGRAVPAGDGQRLAEAISDLAADAETRQAMGARARALFEARFTRELAVTAWDDLLREIVQARPRENKTS